MAGAGPLSRVTVQNQGGGAVGTQNVNVQNFPTVWQVADNGGSITVDGSVNIGNLPSTWAVTDNGGSLTVDDGNGSLTVDGTVNVGNFPAIQPVSGTVSIGNLPATQQVADAGGSLTVDTGTAGVFAPTPTGAAGFGIVPMVAVGVTNLLVKASAGNLYSASVIASSNAPAFYLIALNRATVPAANAALTAAEMLGCQYIFAGSYGTINPDDIPDRFGTGIVLICSTSTTQFVPVTAASILHIKARAV